MTYTSVHALRMLSPDCLPEDGGRAKSLGTESCADMSRRTQPQVSARGLSHPLHLHAGGAVLPSLKPCLQLRFIVLSN